MRPTINPHHVHAPLFAYPTKEGKRDLGQCPSGPFSSQHRETQMRTHAPLHLSFSELTAQRTKHKRRGSTHAPVHPPFSSTAPRNTYTCAHAPVHRGHGIVADDGQVRPALLEGVEKVDQGAVGAGRDGAAEQGAAVATPSQGAHADAILLMWWLVLVVVVNGCGRRYIHTHNIYTHITCGPEIHPSIHPSTHACLNMWARDTCTNTYTHA